MASISGCRTILVSCDGGKFEEGPITATAYPGMNVQMSVQPESTQNMRHSWTPGGTDYVGTGTGQTTVQGSVKLLTEDSLQGNTISTAYAADENCFVYIPRSGDIVQVLVASGQTVAKGDGLSANSAGKWIVDASNPRVEALEASSGALGSDTHARARVL